MFWIPENIADDELREIVTAGELYFHNVMASAASLFTTLTSIINNETEATLEGGDAHKIPVVGEGVAEHAAARTIQRIIRGHLARQIT